MNTSKIIESPLGPLLIEATAQGVCRVQFCEAKTASYEENNQGQPGREVLQQAETELGEYFIGQRRSFTVPLDPAGTPFQQEVWKQLVGISCGATTSYGEIARRIGRPQGSQAVGLANGQNPIAIIIPCHRVVGASGKLTGYAGGIERKKWLLRHEAATLF